MKIVLSALSLALVIANLYFAQVKSVRTFEIPDNASCDNMDSYADEFALEMAKMPAQKGLIVIKPNKLQPDTAIRFSGEVNHAIAFGRFGKNKPTIKYARSDSGDTRAELYVVSVEALPGDELTDQPILPDLEKPFFYNATFSDACETIRLGEFARFLTSNPALRTSDICPRRFAATSAAYGEQMVACINRPISHRVRSYTCIRPKGE
jgi:hypothetical protein